MPSYMPAEESNAMMKTMMLQQICINVAGDDTNSKGFRLIVDDPNDDECDCQLVRSLGVGRNTRVRVTENVLKIDVVGDTPVPTGGGLITVNLVINTDPNRLRRSVAFSWSDPVILTDDTGNKVSAPMPRMTNTVDFDNVFIYRSDTAVTTLNVTRN